MGFLIDQNVDVKKTYAPTITQHEPFEQFTYSPQMDYSYAPVISYNSPGASLTGATVTTKKEQVISQEGSDQVGATTKQEGQQITSDMITPILILAGVGVGGYVLYSMFKKKKKK